MSVPDIPEQVADDIWRERERQDEKWGQQDHEPEVYLAVLMEEVGEAAKEMLELRFRPTVLTEARLRAELVQVAAVATAMRLEHVLGKQAEWTWPQDAAKAIKALVEDVKIESAGEVVWGKDVEKALGKAASRLLKVKGCI